MDGVSIWISIGQVSGTDSTELDVARSMHRDGEVRLWLDGEGDREEATAWLPAEAARKLAALLIEAADAV